MRTPLWLLVAVASGLVVHVVTPTVGQSLKTTVDMNAPAPRLPTANRTSAESGRGPALRT